MFGGIVQFIACGMNCGRTLGTTTRAIRKEFSKAISMFIIL